MKSIFILLFVVTFLMTACSTVYFPSTLNKEKVMKVQTGMTKTDVIQLFENPNYRSVIDGVEVWKYRYSDYDGHHFLQLNFKDDVVESFDSYFVPKYSGYPSEQSSSTTTQVVP